MAKLPFPSSPQGPLEQAVGAPPVPPGGYSALAWESLASAAKATAGHTHTSPLWRGSWVYHRFTQGFGHKEFTWEVTTGARCGSGK